MTDSTLYPCLRTALQQAGSIDVDKVAAVLNSGMKFDSPQGPMMMMSRLDVGNPRTVDSVGTNYIKQIVNGKANIIATIVCNNRWLIFKKPTQPCRQERPNTPLSQGSVIISYLVALIRIDDVYSGGARKLKYFGVGT